MWVDKAFGNFVFPPWLFIKNDFPDLFSKYPPVIAKSPNF